MIRRRALAFLAVLAALAVGVSPARAQDNYTFTLAGFGGIGGPYNVSPSPGLTNRSLMLEASMITQERTLVVLRAARMKFDGDNGLREFREADLDFVTIAGEYRQRQSYYDFGVYLGLGDYRLKGTLPSGSRRDDTALGIALGLTGDFDVSRHFSLVAELSGHYTWLDALDIFAVAHAGVAFHF